MKWPQFSLKELFQSLLLISIGLGCLSVFGRDGNPSPLIMIVGPCLLFTAPVWIGAGIGTPFRQTARGALYGLAVAIGLTLVAVFSVQQAARE